MMSNREAAIRIIRVLRRHGFEALLAGGCVRDKLLGRRAKDYDVTTNAEPRDIKRLFRRTLNVGVQFGVMIVLLGKQQVEVATFRSDAEYHDGRRPSRVRFTTAREDAVRRDFTVNGMFYDPLKNEVIDYVGGQQDLKNHLIRTIGPPHERFSEDYLRMLRAVRFSAQLGFTVHGATLAAMRAHAECIVRISGERIRMELEGILAAPNRAMGAELMIKTGLMHAIFPQVPVTTFRRAVRVLAILRRTISFGLGLAALFSPCDTPLALDQLKVIRLSRHQTKHVRFLLSHRGRLLEEGLSVAQLKLLAGGPYFQDLMELQRAIQRAGNRPVTALTRFKKRVRDLGDVDLHPKPLLNGYDIIRLGAARGPLVGHISEEMYIAQLEGTLQTRAQARQWVKDRLTKQQTGDVK